MSSKPRVIYTVSRNGVTIYEKDTEYMARRYARIEAGHGMVNVRRYTNHGSWQTNEWVATYYPPTRKEGTR